MPSFTRRAGPSSTVPPPGTHPSPSTSLPLLPTGVPSLDDLLGGGLPLGSSLLVLSPDTHSAWGRLLSRYWLAQGLASGQRCCITGEEDGIRDTVRGCMWVDERTGEGSESEGEGIDGGGGEGRGGGKIAWRYEGMGKFRTSTGELRLFQVNEGGYEGCMFGDGMLSYKANRAKTDSCLSLHARCIFAGFQRGISSAVGEVLCRSEKAKRAEGHKGARGRGESG